jgi:hypothetical protein
VLFEILEGNLFNKSLFRFIHLFCFQSLTMKFAAALVLLAVFLALSWEEAHGAEDVTYMKCNNTLNALMTCEQFCKRGYECDGGEVDCTSGYCANGYCTCTY